MGLNFTDNLKIAMIAEAKAWKVQFGRNMNAMYLALMDKIVDMVEDFTKRLARPVKDLDDVRQAMATLKEIRENEIFIDSSLDPIEVDKLTPNLSSSPCALSPGILWPDGEV